MLDRFIRSNINNISIFIFLVLYITIVAAKPAFLFNLDGSIKQFGYGYHDKTVIPFWLLSYLLGVFSYLGVLYYVTYPRIIY
uniref:Uncharacterized protein n=1 Tax=viral metagenome TaxID=1070528 RepID=A0A6C0AWN7_9ZZZZ